MKHLCHSRFSRRILTDLEAVLLCIDYLDEVAYGQNAHGLQQTSSQAA